MSQDLDRKIVALGYDLTWAKRIMSCHHNYVEGIYASFEKVPFGNPKQSLFEELKEGDAIDVIPEMHALWKQGLVCNICNIDKETIDTLEELREF